MTLAAGTRLGPYEIVAPISAGGMGEVYRARDTLLDREVAIQLLKADLAASPKQRRRFEQEVRAAAALLQLASGAIPDLRRHWPSSPGHTW